MSLIVSPQYNGEIVHEKCKENQEKETLSNLSLHKLIAKGQPDNP